MSASKKAKSSAERSPLKLRFVGFCGVDESFTDEQIDGRDWPEYIEWGVLFREEKEGSLRFPKRDWVKKFVAKESKVKHLAAHLCSTRCEQVLRGDLSFVKELHQELGFNRFQINATKGNGVDSERLGDEQVRNIVKLAKAFPDAEFIIQRNEETKPLWHGLEVTIGETCPRNISYLFDASVGRGLVVADFPRPKFQWAKYGYAGGIKPENVAEVVRNVALHVPESDEAWIDMESGIRIKETDVFSAERAWEVCETIELLRKEGSIALVSKDDE